MILTAALLTLAGLQEPTLDSVIERLRKNMQAANTLSVTVDMASEKAARRSYTVRAMRPNFYWAESDNQVMLNDGQDAWIYYPQLKRYGRFMKEESGMLIPLLSGFEMYSPPKDWKPKYERLERGTLGGQDALVLVSEPKEMPGLRLRLFVDPVTYLPLGQEQITGTSVVRTTYRDVRFDRKFTAADFVFSPPEDAVNQDKNPRKLELLSPGEAAPKFDMPNPKGGRLSLDSLLKGKKGLVVNFWFINCGYCLMEFPHLDAMYRKLRAKGLEVVAINDVDAAPEIRKFLAAAKPPLSFPVGVDTQQAAAKAYKVAGQGHPITYVIDASGKIVHTQVGFDTKKGLADLERVVSEKLGVR